MNELIEIEGNLVTLYQKSPQRQMPLEQFLTFAGGRQPVTLPTIARSQVFGHLAPNATDDGFDVFYILSEIPAGIKNITKNFRDNTARRYRLAMPWTYLWFVAYGTSADHWELSDYRVFFSRERYTGMDTPFISALLPNVYDNGSICWGSAGTSPNQSLADRIDILTNEWYLSRFNTDLDGSNPLPWGEPNYGRWVRESVDNPECWRTWPEWDYRPRHSVRTLLSDAQVNVRPTLITLGESIPEIPITPTFGRWEEWWSEHIPAEQRGRALLALNNLRADNPDLVPDNLFDEAEPNSTTPDGVTDDGGIEVPYAR